MSGYQSLADLIADHAGQDLNANQIEGLANAIILDWVPAEVEAVNEAKRQAVKQRAQLVNTRTDLEQAQMTANAPDINSGAM